jgi:hypothetical protein
MNFFLFYPDYRQLSNALNDPGTIWMTCALPILPEHINGNIVSQ